MPWATFHTIRTALDSGVPFERMEAQIESMDGLDEEERAVLWLYAWCEGRAAELRELLMSTETLA